MIDFSAFPARRSRNKALATIVCLVVFVGLVTSFVLLAQPSDAERKLGMTLFQIIIFSIVAVMSVILIIIPIWFVRRIIVPRIRSMTEGTFGKNLSAYNSTDLFEQFASDNGFQYHEYPLQTPAPKPLYEALYKVTEYDSVYLLYQITGTHEGTDFTLYCLAFAEGIFPALVSRRGMAYAHDSDSRKIEYATVLMLPNNASRHRRGIFDIANLSDNTYIYCEGYLTDRKILKDMFAVLEEKD